MSHVWLVRHAESTADKGLAIGVTDPPLSDLGREQAGRLAKTMAIHPLVRIVSSDRKRALATARAVADRHGLAVERTAAMRELDFGGWEGRSLSGLWSEEPVAAQAWEADIRMTPASFGESMLELEVRVRTFWNSLQPLPEVGEIAIVAHRGSLAVLRALITGETVSDAFATGFALGAAVGLTPL